MLSAMHVADTAVLLISAPSGIEVGSIQAWNAAEEAGLPRVIVVNKLDRPETDFDEVVASIQDAWGRNCVPVQAPEGSGEGLTAIRDLLEGDVADMPEEMVEAIAESDDDLMMMYLEGEDVSADDLREGLKAAIRNGSVVPIFATAADKEIGVEQLMDAIIDLFLEPAEEMPEGVSDDVPANLIFKTSADPFVGKVSYLRVYGAPLLPNSQLVTGSSGDSERIAQVYSPGRQRTDGSGRGGSRRYRGRHKVAACIDVRHALLARTTRSRCRALNCRRRSSRSRLAPNRSPTWTRWRVR